MSNHEFADFIFQGFWRQNVGFQRFFNFLSDRGRMKSGGQMSEFTIIKQTYSISDICLSARWGDTVESSI